MARIRTIKPSFFTSLTVASLPVEARLTFIGLWTHVDDGGRCIYDPRLIKAALWPLDDRTAADVGADIALLNANDLVTHYIVTEPSVSHPGVLKRTAYLSVRGWHEHQRINRPTESTLPNPSDGEIVPLTCMNEGSVSTHTQFTEPSPQEGKGREGNKDSAPTERVAATASTEQDVLDVEVDEPPRPETAQTLVSEWIDHCSGGRPPDRVIGHVSREVGSLLDQGFSYAEVRTALAEWHSRGIDASKIPAILHELRTAPDRRPRGRPSSIETRLARNRQVVEAFRAEERAR